MQNVAMNGDQAIAFAWKQIDPDVVASYPITPQTIIVEMFSEFVADGLVNTEYVCAESEHSAMSLCIGASAAGARVCTATASAGLAFMWETLYIASGMRLPIVMAVANRALSGPINIHCDHSDAMGARDSGWIQVYAENVQEAYDNTLMAFRIAEHMDIRLPMMTCLDGFITTHSLERFQPLEDEVVKKFVGEFKWKRSLLDIEHPTTMGPFDWTDYYFEHKYQQEMAMRKVPSIATAVAEEFHAISGREYELIEPYKLEDADYAVVAMGSTSGTLKQIVDDLRAEGKRVGSLKIRLFRPFPQEEVTKSLSALRGVAVLDRALSIGSTGPLFPEIRSALYDSSERPRLVNYVYGLGGRDVRPDELRSVYEALIANKGETMNFLGVRA
jgi:pyruvate ferredoxin oxidoreductase alpha subunit